MKKNNKILQQLFESISGQSESLFGLTVFLPIVLFRKIVAGL